MAKQEIITALQNSVERGENLAQAKQILINSGYNTTDVEEASQFVGQGTISFIKIKPQEELAFPESKGFLSRFRKQIPSQQPQQSVQQQPIQQQNQQQNQAQPIQSYQPPYRYNQYYPENQPMQTQQQIQNQQIPQPSSFQSFSPKPLVKQLQAMQPPKKSRKKIIILLIILLVLIGGLITVLLLKDQILSFLGFE